MKVFAHNTGMLLHEKCAGISDEHTRWRCVYVNFAFTGGYTRTLRSFIIDTVIATLASEEGAIYLCEDGDIVILFEGALKPVAKLLGSHFEDFNLAISHPARDNPFSIFDLSSQYDWLMFSHLCDTKHMLLAESSMIGTALAEGMR